MKKHHIQEAVPVAAAILSAALGGLIAGVGVSLYSSKFQMLLIIFAVTAVAFTGVFFSGLPQIEYIIVLFVTALIALSVAPWWRYIVILPGIFMGYYWGCWLADILDRPNTERKRNETDHYTIR